VKYDHTWNQIRELERALGSLRRLGLDELNPTFKVFGEVRRSLYAQIGTKFPKPISLILKLVGLSPGTLTLFHDSESGWLTAARSRPGAPPVYRKVSDEIALQLIRGEVTHALEESLLIPDENIDN